MNFEMSNNTFILKAGPDGKAKFQMIIPVQYCTNELFKDISLTITGKASQNINVKKSNLQFEVELEESIGEHMYSMALKKNGDQIDSREIILSVIQGENQEYNDLVIRFRETCSLFKKGESKSVSSIYYNESDDLLLVGETKSLRHYKKRTLELIETLEGHSDNIVAIVYDESSGSYLTAGKDKIIRWDLVAGSPMEIITDFVLGFWTSALSLFKKDSKVYFISSEQSQSFFTAFNLYDKNDKIQIEKKNNYTPSIVKYNGETNNLFFGSTPEDSVKIFSLTDNRMIQNKIMLESGAIRNITIIPGGKYFMTHSQNSDHFKIWTFNEWKLYKKVPIRKEPSSSDIVDVILDDKNSEFIIVYRSGTIDVYDWYGIAD